MAQPHPWRESRNQASSLISEQWTWSPNPTQPSQQRYPDSMKRIVVACVILLLVLAGCAGTSTPQETTGPVADANYLGLIGNEGPANLDDAALIRVGHLVCKNYDKNPDASGWRIEVMALVISGSFTRYQSSLVVTAAIGAYCPQYGKYIPGP